MKPLDNNVSIDDEVMEYTPKENTHIKKSRKDHKRKHNKRPISKKNRRTNGRVEHYGRSGDDWTQPFHQGKSGRQVMRKKKEWEIDAIEALENQEDDLLDLIVEANEMLDFYEDYDVFEYEDVELVERYYSE